MSAQTLADRIDALLPQTQCTRCGYPACRPYAEALARGETTLNRCPPGGVPTIERLAQLLGTDPLPLDPDCGAEAAPRVAWIDEPRCIGCARCIDVCPTDAIVGARRFLHTVISADCSGCDLCLPVCPVDCIVMRPVPELPSALDATAIAARAAHFRPLYARRAARREAEARAWREALDGHLGTAEPAP